MQIIECSATFTRPNDTNAYTSGDLMANSTTAGSVTPMTFVMPYGRGFKLWRVKVEKSDVSVTNASYRLHLYKDSPTVTNGDNGAIASTVSNYLGFVDIVGTAPLFSDDAHAYGIYVNNSLAAPMVFTVDSDRLIYGLLEARGAYTPAAQEVFVVKLIAEAYV